MIYARVSSREQEREGFSIPAQLKLNKDCALKRGIKIIREFVDVETAKCTGRKQFDEMYAFSKSTPIAELSLSRRPTASIAISAIT